MKIRNSILILGIFLVLFLGKCAEEESISGEGNLRKESTTKESPTDEVDLAPRPTRSKK